MQILYIGDLHFGEHGNSAKYNNQLLDFIEWCTNAFPDVDAVVQLGDFYHHRNKVDILTMNYAIAGAIMMRDAWGRGNVYVLSGNHDLYYLDRLDISSIVSINPYVTVVDSFTTIDNGRVLLCPWIATPAMWEQMLEIDGPEYCAGHFELNGFKVNDAYVMESGFSPATLDRKFKATMSGHYHTTQKKGGVTYTGTPLPITMNEANEAHGVFLHDTDTNELTFHEYDRVKVLSIPYDELDGALEGLDPENTTIRVEFPDDLEDETLITDVSQRLAELKFTNSKVKYKGQKLKQILDADVGEIVDVENIDAVVVQFIDSSIKVSGVDNEALAHWYKQAIERSKGNTGE